MTSVREYGVEIVGYARLAPACFSDDAHFSSDLGVYLSLRVWKSNGHYFSFILIRLSACRELAMASILDRPRLVTEGAKPSDGVPDMTIISDIDEYGINTNLKVRYQQDRIYVSKTRKLLCFSAFMDQFIYFCSLDIHWDDSCGRKSLQATENLQ